MISLSFDRGVVQRAVIAVAIGGFHDHRIRLLKRHRIVEQRRAAWSEIAGKHNDLPVAILGDSQFNTG